MAVENPIIKLVDPLTKREVALSNAGGISWALTPGLAPHVSNFKLIEPRALEFVKGLKGPVELHLAGKVFKNLFVTRVIKADQTDAFIRVADIRCRFDYYIHAGRYNIRRPSGELFTIVSDTAGDALLMGSKDRYQPWSLNPFLNLPWTAYWLAQHIINDFVKVYLRDMHEAGLRGVVAPIVRSEGGDNGYIPMDVELDGTKTTAAVGALFAQADREITVTADGDIKLFNPRSRILAPRKVAPLGGVLSQPDLSRIRPKQVVVYFPKERERLIRNAPANRSRVYRPTLQPDATDIYAVNVCRVPFKATISGNAYPAGSWVDLALVAAHLASDAAGVDKLDEFSGLTSLLKAQAVGGDGFVGLWATANSRTVEGLRIPNERKVKWAAAMLESFGTHWQIDPDVFIHVRSWAPETTEFIDSRQGDAETSTTTWTKRPSPVYTEWTDEWTYYYNVREKRATAVAPNDSFSSTPYQPAPFMVEIVDSARGVFAIHPLQEASGYLHRRTVGYLEGIPIFVDPRKGLLRGAAFQKVPGQSKIRSAPNMQTVLTFVEGTPNDRGHLHAITLPGDPNGTVPKLELYHHIERARFDKDNKLRNPSILADIAKAEAQVAMDTFADRPVGAITLAFKAEDQWEVSGHVSGINFRADHNGGVVVEMMCADSLPATNVLGMMPQHVRAYLQRSEIAVEGS